MGVSHEFARCLLSGNASTSNSKEIVEEIGSRVSCHLHIYKAY